MHASPRPPTSFILTSCCLVALSLGCATGSDDLGDSSTFASFDSGNVDEIDTDDGSLDTGDTGDTTTGDGDTTTSTTTTGDGDTETSTTDTSTTDTSGSTDDVPPDPCGDGMIDPGEECDGIDLGGATCVSQGFDMGQLGCNDDCTFDDSACETIQEFCGDGIVNLDEQCEAGMIGNATCLSAGFVYGNLSCNGATCLFDTSGCQNSWIVDFEAGVVPAGWSGGGNAQWSITNADKHAGTYGARSGVITHSQSTWAQVTVQYPIAGSVDFWHKISSESGWDYGRFLIDGVQQNQWSGSGAWAQYNVAVGAGQHVFRWAYEKDASVTSFSDAWFVDDITFTGGYVP